MKSMKLNHHFLIASPNLDDSFFERAVVYIYEYTPQGAMGLMINKPLNVSLSEVFSHLDLGRCNEAIADLPVFMGGPVGREHGFVIYSQQKDKEGLVHELNISSSKDTLSDIAAGKGPEQFLFTLGYTGWNAGQVEQEIRRNDWLVAPFEPGILFDTPIERRWLAAGRLIGIDLNRLSSHVGNA